MVPHSEVVTEYITKECTLSRMIGPFCDPGQDEVYEGLVWLGGVGGPFPMLLAGVASPLGIGAATLTPTEAGIG